jgi:tetratricopeptide (TPR) repeat protein
MADPTPSDYHLTYLRERWERDRSSRVFLQLAEEYRRRGLHSEALEVLEVGLRHHPGYLAAQVALGRCLMEAGQLARAGEVLERVLTQDPTQAVAIRLLAETGLRLRDPRRTREAIDRCRLLGVPPAELEAFEQRLRTLDDERLALGAPADDAVVSTPSQDLATGAELSVEEAIESAGSYALEEADAQEPPGGATTSWETPELPSTSDGLETALVGAAIGAAVSEASRPQDAVELFGDVFPLPRPAATPVALSLAPEGATRASARAGTSDPFALTPTAVAWAPPAGDVFVLPALPQGRPIAAPAPALAAAPSRHEGEQSTAAAVAELPQPEPTSEPAPALAGEDAAPLEETIPAEAMSPVEEMYSPEVVPPVEEVAPAEAEVPWADMTPAEDAIPAAYAPVAEEHATAAAEPVVPEAEPWAEEAAAPGLESAEPALEAADALWSPPSAPEPLPPPPPAVSPPPPAPQQAVERLEVPGVEVQASGALPAAELRASEPGTATLGELYLRQGYLVEAERIFRQVLERDSESEAALKGLETIGRRRAASISASELLTGDEEAGIRGVSARKILLLDRYLHTLRRGARNDVPGTSE